MRSLILAGVCCLSLIGPVRGQESAWSEPFGIGLDDDVYALKATGDGFLFAGGAFRFGAGHRLNGVGRWDGTRWTPLGGGVTGHVRAIEIVGDNVFVAGHFSHALTAEGDSVDFTRNIARWDGTEWHAMNVGTVALEDTVFALAEHSGQLYVGGNFQVLDLGGLTVAQNVATWNGLSWSGAGFVDGTVRTIASSPLGPVIGGAFTGTSGGNGTQFIAYWNGEWRPLGLGTSGRVTGVASASDGIYVSGEFHALYQEDGTEVRPYTSPMYVARFRSGEWQLLPHRPDFLPLVVEAGPSGEVYFGGNLNGIEDAERNTVVESWGVVKWNGIDWEALGNGLHPGNRTSSGGNAFAIEAEPGSIWVGGSFENASQDALGPIPAHDVRARNIARFGGQRWHALGYGLNDITEAVEIWDGPDGRRIVFGGDFSSATNGTISRSTRLAAAWDPEDRTWESLGSGLTWDASGTPTVRELAVYDGDLILGGTFRWAYNGPGDSLRVNLIARWDGTSFHTLGGGLDNDPLAFLPVGPDLYVGGRFGVAVNPDGSEVSVRNLARWDGSEWHAVGGGTNSSVYALAESGGNLIVGGSFDQVGIGAGFKDAVAIALWDGSAWQTMGGFSEGLGLFGDPVVYSLAATETDVYAAGDFVAAVNPGGGLVEVNHVARWDGASWNGLAGGIAIDRRGGNPVALDLLNRAGSVYLSGEFDVAGGVEAFSLARWDGEVWHAVGGFNQEWGRTASLRDLASEPTRLYAAGWFQDVDGFPSGFVAQWNAEIDLTSGVDVPRAAQLSVSAYPNPFGDQLRLAFELPQPGRVRVDVYDLLGRRVVGREYHLEAGTNRLSLDTRGSAPGVYLYRIVREGRVVARGKAVRVR